ncbi:DivIVA domain-containing protein [Dialister micraerophilus]|uniref:DivIVA domain-containing protein n=1 Tax=Dialister micraerophilus TaxID=309120 RepID=UPI0023F00260|nr:DivIVA domain-containing protein [Dialister micraerophilus]
MITPMDIHNKTFSRQLRGYSQEEVNAFLEELASDYEKIYREHREAEEEMDTIRTKLRNYEKMEATMSSTLVMAQETAENVKRAAEKEAELCIREAKAKASKIVADAESARREINANLIKTEGDLNLYIEKILSNFKSAFSLVESCKLTPAPEIIEEPENAPHEDDLYAEELSSKAEETEEIEETTENKEESTEADAQEKTEESNE